MSGNHRAAAGRFWGLCVIALVASDATWAQQLARVSGKAIQQWIDGSADGYAALYAPMNGW